MQLRFKVTSNTLLRNPLEMQPDVEPVDLAESEI